MNHPGPTAPGTEESYRHYRDHLLAGNRRQCQAVFEAWLEGGIGLRTLYQQLVHRSLYEVGDLWAQGRISVATEHLATAITESLLNLVYPRLFATPRHGPLAVVSCAANEHHQIGGKMVADLFELHGWRSHFLGAGSSVETLRRFIHEHQPAAVALSATLSSSLPALLDAARDVRQAFPEIPILAGGQAFPSDGAGGLPEIPRARVIRSLEELEAWIDHAQAQAQAA